MDSSSYTITAGQNVTFTARLMGNATAPTGTVAFKANGNTIAGCSTVTVSNSTALCTTNSLTAGSYQITGAYSGDSVYSNGLAGPITQTVNVAPAMKLGIDSSQYTSLYGAAVTFTVTVTGGMNPTGTFRFTDGSNTIAGSRCGRARQRNGHLHHGRARRASTKSAAGIRATPTTALAWPVRSPSGSTDGYKRQ